MRVLNRKNRTKKAEVAKPEGAVIRIPDPVYYHIDVDELNCDHYQRTLKKRRAKSYADDFDEDIFTAILVSYRDKKYWVLDGQHRVEMAKILGIKTMMCQVLTGLTYEQESLKFDKINKNRIILNANERFHSQVEGKEKTAVDIANVLHRYGFEYSKCGNEKRDDCITAVASVKKIYNCGEKQSNTNGSETLAAVLDILRKAYNGSQDSVRADIMTGLHTFMQNYRYDKKFLIRTLETITPMGLCAEAMQHTKNAARHSRADGNCFHIAKTIRDLYDEEAIKTHGSVPVCSYK